MHYLVLGTHHRPGAVEEHAVSVVLVVAPTGLLPRGAKSAKRCLGVVLVPNPRLATVEGRRLRPRTSTHGCVHEGRASLALTVLSTDKLAEVLLPGTLQMQQTAHNM
jgi:hypothetical protein